MNKFRLNAWWGSGVGLSALVAAAYGFAPNPPQVGLLQSAEAQHQVLKEIDAAIYAPDSYEAYLRAVEGARFELAAQREKFYYSRQYLTFDRMCREALEASGASEKMARENRSSIQVQVASQTRQIAGIVSEIRNRVSRWGMSSAGRSRLTRAEVLLREGELQAAAGEWHRANEILAAAMSAARSAQGDHDERVSRLNNSDLMRQWDRWVKETVDGSSRSSSKAILVVKAYNLCLLVSDGRVVRRYSADFGKNGVFDKTYRGDHATPEGKYKVIKKKNRGQSKYHKALLINYPNDEDVRMFRRSVRHGLLNSRSRMGGSIEIHGDGGRDENWTEGCVALANADMDDLFSRVDTGTPVTIVGNCSEFDRLTRPSQNKS